MEININKLQYEPGMKQFFRDCYHVKVTEYEIMQKLFYLLSGGSTYRKLKEHSPDFTRQELTDAIGCIIKNLKLNVNEPCCQGRQDLMYHAIKYGTAKDVEMLFKNGYNGTNYISGETVYGYLSWDFPEYAEKVELFKKYGQDYVKRKDSNEIISYNDSYKESLERQKTHIKSFDIEEFAIRFHKNPVACSILKGNISFNADKATTKLVSKLCDLDVSMKDMKTILENGSFVDYSAGIDRDRRERKKLDVYYKLLESEGIKLPEENKNTKNSIAQGLEENQPGS